MIVDKTKHTKVALDIVGLLKIDYLEIYEDPDNPIFTCVSHEHCVVCLLLTP